LHIIADRSVESVESATALLDQIRENYFRSIAFDRFGLHDTMSLSSADKLAMEARWESHKNTMRQVYLVQDNSLAHLMDVMRSSHNFEAR
jgi:hypothetical protein